MVASDAAAVRQRRAPTRMRFGLQLSSFGAGPATVPLASRLAETAAVAEAVGFSSLWVLDHMVQIPQVGLVSARKRPGREDAAAVRLSRPRRPGEGIANRLC